MMIPLFFSRCWGSVTNFLGCPCSFPLSRILYNNKLTQLPVDGFNRLNNLKRLRLDGNAIDCNCGVYSLWRRWHLDVQRQLVSISLTCASPQVLQNQGLSSLSEHHFKCGK